ncbi:NADPH:quinone oxidoreductase family protein [Paenibacillus sp. ACRSA]|uniref:quinone oxidoreductase family protein n=1 Tax=Paenibacillus sp. ACRSA TaxID=2918211 RepID=UPI001EF56E12|nr:NADPH:quinone oxidoreductase family protein [Paenibacillus sp. ACRSA]MCG7380723.1 NADPH:quinone oxidoreductase family protein [Paenibacillus sp. ACRSA]
MKAILVEEFGSTENMRYVDVEIPSIGSKQVLIRVMATSVNFADVKARYGNKGQGKIPFIPGLEASGIIEQVGDEVASLAVGQRVMAFPHHGSYAEYIVADENLTFAIPDSIPFDVAGSCGIVSFLSYKLLADVANIQDQDQVLIHSASGGVGTTAIQVARALGAKTIIGTVGNESKIPVALEAGADHVICYTHENFTQRVNDMTNGTGANIILDSIGGEITEQSMNCLSRYGRLVVFGNSSGKYAQLQASELHSSCRSVLGFSLGTTRKERPQVLKDTSLQVFRMLERGQIKLNISQKLPLKDAPLAHQFIESRNSTGKIVLYTEHS